MKSYQETLDFLFSQIPQFQKIGQKAYKANLDNIRAICDVLQNPQNNLPTIHVAGSNGKGSTSHMLASVLYEAGYKVGLYTSPHLKDFRERIKINGQEISEEKVIQFVEEFQPKLKEINPSFFEWTVGLAFYYFHQEKTDINVIETGLGGRLDSTNIIQPVVSVITNISLEHTAILGDTIEKIAAEKAGIIKFKTPVIIGKTQKKTTRIFEKQAELNESPIFFADSLPDLDVSLDLIGQIQQENAKTAWKTCEVLATQGFETSENERIRGLENVLKNTRLQGRFQIVSTSPLIVFDTAHNPDGMKTLCKEIKRINPTRIHFVLGMARDKNHDDMFKQFPQNSLFYFCSSTNERVISGKSLKEIAFRLNHIGEDYSSVKSGLEAAKKAASKKDMIVVTGSNFVIADVLSSC